MTFVPQKLKPKPVPGLANRWNTRLAKSEKRKPHVYQKRGVEWLVSRTGAALFADPGTGKSIMVLRALLALKDSGTAQRTLIIAPLRVATQVWPNEAAEWEETEWSRVNELKMVVLHGKNKEKRREENADVYVINPDGLKWLFADNYKEFLKMEIDTLVIDECFSGDTKVSTSQGMLKISTLKKGTLVYTELGLRKVKRVSKRRPKGALVQLNLSNGKTIKATEDHIFFTEIGWLSAKYLEGRRLLCLAEVSSLRQQVPNVATPIYPLSFSANLLKILLAESNVATNDQENSRAYIRKRSKKLPRNTFLEQGYSLEQRSKKENCSYSQSSGVATLERKAGRQWKTIRSSRKQSTKSLAKEFYLQLCSRVGRKAARLSLELQSRFWRSTAKISSRNRRPQPQFFTEKAKRQKERRQAEGTWVESVTRIKHGSVSHIFNLEVEGCPHFEVEGSALVHNSTLFKHTRTKRFRALKPLLPSFTRRWILTGTPTPNGFMDIFGQIYCVDLGRALGRFITHYRFEYFTPLDRFGWTWALKAGAEKRIQEKIAPYVFRLDAEDYLEMPEVVENVIRVELPPQARKVYDEIENEMITELEQHTVIAVSIGAAQIKCAQVACGGLYHMAEDGDQFGRRTWTNLHEAKTEAVAEIVDELNGSPCLVVYDFKHDLDRLKKALGENTPHIGGGVGPKESEEIIARWNRDEIPALLVHPAAVSHGLNLQYGTAKHIIWHSLTYDRELYDQLNRRLRRQGSRAKNIFVHHIVARDTTDEVRMQAIRKKGKSQQNFLDALKAYARTRRK